MRVSFNRLPINGLSINRPYIDKIPTAPRGATIVVVLIILLAMTLTAISMMNTAILQEQIAANSRQKTVSRYVTESALNQAERVIRVKKFGVERHMTPLFDRQVKGYYSATDLFLSAGIIKTSTPVDFDITDMTAWDENINSVAIIDVIENAITAKPPQYIIEYIGRQQPNSVNIIVQSEPTYFFRVTAIGWGKDPKIYTILQSIYRLRPKTKNVNTTVFDGDRVSWSIIH